MEIYCRFEIFKNITITDFDDLLKQNNYTIKCKNKIEYCSLYDLIKNKLTN